MEGKILMKLEAIGKPQGCKLLRISVELTEPPGDESMIMAISIRGDFFAIPEEAFDTFEKRLAGTRLGALESTFDTATEELHLNAIGISGPGILTTIRGAIHETSVQNTANGP
jgi:hypothetical protein